MLVVAVENPQLYVQLLGRVAHTARLRSYVLGRLKRKQTGKLMTMIKATEDELKTRKPICNDRDRHKHSVTG